MFSGIIESVGNITAINRTATNARLEFDTATLSLNGAQPGASIAVNGACLTVVELLGNGFSADLSSETLVCTTFDELEVGARVNLERALVLGDSLDGHLVTGHVDGVGTVHSVSEEGDSLLLEVTAPRDLARYIARKGSVCIDGVSLTVNSIAKEVFGLMIVPHTQSHTIIAGYVPGSLVNLEVDLIARYLERFVQYTE
jgi:riboflavin synthase